MNRQERTKKIVSYLIWIEQISFQAPQKDIADKIGSSSVNVSRALNGDEKYLTDNFLKRMNKSYGDIFNPEWLLTGNGEMLIEKPISNIESNTDYKQQYMEMLEENRKLRIELDVLKERLAIAEGAKTAIAKKA